MGGDGTGDASGGTGHGGTVEIPRGDTEPPAEPEAEQPEEPAGASADEPEPDDEPAVSSPPEEPTWSAAAAALLNLTGLGLGYLYLRCWLRATACIVIVALMVVVAFTNDASSSPWLWRILLATWAVATAVDAWGVARLRRRPVTAADRL